MNQKLEAMAAQGLNDKVIKKVLGDIREKRLETVNILDLGSGQGYNAHYIHKELSAAGIPHSITCTDINADNFKVEGVPEIAFVARDLNDDFIIGEFDFVIGTEIIEHIENPYHFIRNCMQNLSKNGVLYVTTPNAEHLFSLVKQALLGRPMWFSVNEPSGHITPIHGFMIHEAMRRIEKEEDIKILIERSFNRNCFPVPNFQGRLKLITLPGNDRLLGEINIFRINCIST